MIEVSIIIPVYNAEPFLRQCIDSVLAQSFTDWELILVDDASTDGSREICRSYADRDPRIKLIEARKGEVSATRNRGIEAARGNFIMFIDADDTITPDALALLHSYTRRGDIIVGQFVYSRKNPLTEARGSDCFEVVSPVEAIVRTLYQERAYHNSVWAKLFARHIFDENRFVEGRKYEDLECTIRFYMSATKIVVLQKEIYWYRENPDSFINSLSAARADALWAVDTLLEQARAISPEAVRAAESRRFSAYYNIFGIALKMGNKQLVDRCLAYVRAHRRNILADPRTRLKNKAGAALSYLGFKVMKIACSRIY